MSPDSPWVPVVVIHAIITIASFAYAVNDEVHPKRVDDMSREALVVWQVLWANTWFVRAAWYALYGLWVAARAVGSFVQWAFRRVRGVRIPRARVVAK